MRAMGIPVGTRRPVVAPRRNEAILARVLEDEVVLFDPQTNKIHSLNPTAFFLWEHCDGERTSDQLVTLVCRRFDVAADRAAIDVSRLLDTMNAQALIVW